MATTEEKNVNLIQDTAMENKIIKIKKKMIDKSIEHVLKALNSLKTPEEKLAALCKKYAEFIEENRKNKAKINEVERQLAMSEKEKDFLRTDNNRALLGKSRLESLCRELQKQNTTIREEFDVLAKNEDLKRKLVSEKFQNTITDIQGQMNDHYDKSDLLRKENENLTEKIKQFYNEFKKREKEYENVMLHSAEQLKVSEENITKICTQNLLMQKEKTLSLLQIEEYKKRIIELTKQEDILQNQIKLYTEKYSDFQESLNKSNDIFKNFQQEMNRSNKHSKKLQKENIVLMKRCEINNVSLIEMAENKRNDDLIITKQSSRIDVLEKLCRALQSRKDTADSAVESNSRASDLCKTDAPEQLDLQTESPSTAVNGHAVPEPNEVQQQKERGDGAESEAAEVAASSGIGVESSPLADPSPEESTPPAKTEDVQRSSEQSETTESST